MTDLTRIVLDPTILAGKPVIRGTRIAVDFIIELLADGWNEKDILQNYPGLSHDDVAACLAYARDVLYMGLNIKNDETCRLVEELAKLTGETLTGAVTQAVRERLDRLHRERGGRLADRLLLIGKDCAARLKEPFRSADHGDLLYDRRGLPR